MDKWRIKSKKAGRVCQCCGTAIPLYVWKQIKDKTKAYCEICSCQMYKNLGVNISYAGGNVAEDNREF